MLSTHYVSSTRPRTLQLFDVVWCRTIVSIHFPHLMGKDKKLLMSSTTVQDHSPCYIIAYVLNRFTTWRGNWHDSKIWTQKVRTQGLLFLSLISYHQDAVNFSGLRNCLSTAILICFSSLGGKEPLHCLNQEIFYVKKIFLSSPPKFC